MKQQWIESVRSDFPAWNESVEAELWGCLKSYLTRLFRRHGAQTALIVSGQRFSDAELDKSIGELMTSSIAEECKVVDQNLARNALKKFLREQTPERARYVAQLLDGTFSFIHFSQTTRPRAILKKQFHKSEFSSTLIFCSGFFTYTTILKTKCQPSWFRLFVIRSFHLNFNITKSL